MTTNTQIHIALMDKVKAFANTNSLPYNVIGKDFNEPSSGAWLELSIAPNDRDFGLNESRVFRRGIAQINVCNKKNNGVKQLTDIADLLEAEFSLASSIVDMVVVSANPKVSEPFQRGGAFILPLSFEYSE